MLKKGERKRDEKMKGQYVRVGLAVLAMVAMLETPSWAKNKSLGVERDETLVMPSASPNGSLERDIKKKQVLEKESGIATAPAQKGKTRTKRRTPAKPTQSAPSNLQIKSDEGVNLSLVTVQPLTSESANVFITNKSQSGQSLMEPFIKWSEIASTDERLNFRSRTIYSMNDDGKVSKISHEEESLLSSGGEVTPKRVSTSITFSNGTIQISQDSYLPALHPSEYSLRKGNEWEVLADSLSKQGIEGASSSSVVIEGELGNKTKVTTVFVESLDKTSIIAFSFAKDGGKNAPPILVSILPNTDAMKKSIETLKADPKFGSGSQTESVLWSLLKQGSTVFQAEATLIPKKG
jgi:hypothetical protein